LLFRIQGECENPGETRTLSDFYQATSEKAKWSMGSNWERKLIYLKARMGKLRSAKVE